MRKINQAWLNNQWSELHAYLHPDIVFVPSSLPTPIKGRDACIQTYRDFIQQAEVKKYQESEPSIDTWQDTAVARCAYSIHYQMENKIYQEQGYDIFVFSKQGGTWQAVWRMMTLDTSS
ncbi:MAG: nuclear transport factor 2 family protein [Bacteroidia bacterium]|nr:nuclear transport factor 2 family protein [Bacteroidia bacterium]